MRVGGETQVKHLSCIMAVPVPRTKLEQHHAVALDAPDFRLLQRDAGTRDKEPVARENAASATKSCARMAFCKGGGGELLRVALCAASAAKS